MLFFALFLFAWLQSTMCCAFSLLYDAAVIRSSLFSSVKWLVRFLIFFPLFVQGCLRSRALFTSTMATLCATGLLDLPNDVLRLFCSELDNWALLSFRLAIGKRSFAIEDHIFMLLLSRATVLHVRISQKAIADVLVKTFNRPLFLTRANSNLAFVGPLISSSSLVFRKQSENT
jgi:hypothetical protein